MSQTDITPPVLNQGEDPLLPLPPAQDSRRNAFYQFFPHPLGVPTVPSSFSERVQILASCFRRMQKHCALCYFLRRINPIKIIQTSRGALLDTLHDHHTSEFERCPSRFVSPGPYRDFSSHISASLHSSFSGGAGWFVCSTCTEPYKDALYHERCIYGEDFFLLSYLIWQHPPTLHKTFSLLHASGVSFPDFQNITAYAQWLGNSADLAVPNLNHIHLVTIAYHLLRWAGQLPSVPYPDVEDVIIYREKIML
ncbi:hypothetical protein L210DRAFT_3655538 [Boletus edulis BED1]|uniref:Uncharacterized protein n=1 Tax=Boletus edulis BED1 TaxID=1328754 RepID=A0AAD4BCY8_BOLED|nr:hypothetical protein L210DRAFT_3655538 [Boletus edulis BED1]